MNLASNLEKLNFSSNEASVYLALMRLGEGTALDVARLTNIPKSTAFETLRSLNQKKLVSSYRRKNKNIFSVANPNTIIEDLEQQTEIAEKILPELKGLYHAMSRKGQMRFFEGPKAIELVLKEALGEARQLKIIGSLKDVMDFYSQYFPNFSRQRVAKKIPLRLITSDSEVAQENILLDKKQLRETRILKNKKFTSMIWLWPKKAAFVATTGKQFAMIIDDAEIFQLQESMFDFIWEAIKLHY